MAALKVLLVEDDSIWLKIIPVDVQDALRGIGHGNDPITIARTFDEGWHALLKEGPWNLLIADIALPAQSEMLGKQLVLCAYRLEVRVPTIVISAFCAPQEVSDFFTENKVECFFEKRHYSSTRFIAKIQEILRRVSTPVEGNLAPGELSNSNSNRQHFEIPAILAPVEPIPAAMRHQDIDRLVDGLAHIATTRPNISSREYLRDLVNRAHLPQRWKQELTGGWTGNANVDVRNLIIWAIAQDINPQNPQFTTLGSILEPLLRDVGLEKTSLIVALISTYRLYRDERLLEDLRLRYQVPISAGGSSITPDASDFSSAIDWQAPTDEVQLQSWFKPEPDLLDVGFLMRAIQQATSVCRIEIPNLGVRATGFLLTRNLLLTNYHVFKPVETADIEASAREAILRFGCFTSDTANETEGQTFRLVSDRPILHYSPTNQLDYVLLQVEDSILQAKDISPVRWDHETLPRERMGVTIMQHPEGASMKLAISSNGITGVDRNKGRIQYVTRTSTGSSGSPCFNDHWRVVALHHAQRSASFGTIREGILFSSIYEEIKTYLE